jgi:peroxiredoxin
VQLVELQGRLKDIQRSGLGLIAISYDSQSVLADFAQRRGITFPLVSDPGSKVIRQFGILNTTVPETNREQYGIPFPGTFIVDRDGVVTSRYFETAYQERNTVASLMARLGRNMAAPATKITASHLSVTTYLTDQTAAPGTHFSIVVDIQPGRHVHVYAPGVSGYKPIALTLESPPGLLPRGQQFPPSEDFYFKPLNEHVRVYQKPFRIVQDIAVDASPDGVRSLGGRDRLTITGTLNYQACDDTVCFTPQSIPLTWTVHLKSLDRERAKKP